MFGLYLHIPFCAAICNYCNFNRGLFDAGLKARYVDALAHHIAECGLRNADWNADWNADSSADLNADLDRDSSARVAQNPRHASGLMGECGVPADSIYFGGGTPSLLEPDEVARLIAACRAYFDVTRDAEVTLEANPETVTCDRLAAFRAAGVNRLSIGVQSFRDDELLRLSRLHTANRACDVVGEARRAGFDNVSIDLMMWLPQQRVSEWLESVDAAIRVEPDHVSLYLLELYPNAPLRDAMARANWSQAPDEDAEAMYLTALGRFESAGLEQYEISNAARPGRRARHNLKYWQDGEWLGFGCGAHSTRDGVRWKNVSSTEAYVARIATGQPVAVDVRRLPPAERLGDALFTGLRLVDGVDLPDLAGRYGVDVWERYGRELQRFVEAGLLVHGRGRLRLTRRGMLLAHEVMAVFV